eukprot:4408130-Karenia_brevis.AAC.1
MCSSPPVCEDLTPRQALNKLCERKLTQEDREQWIEESRLAAILGSCSRTLPSVASGLRLYM